MSSWSRASASAAGSRTAAGRSGPARQLAQRRPQQAPRRLGRPEARSPTAGLTSVIVPTYEDGELTTACVQSLLAAGHGRASRSSSGTTARRRGGRRPRPAGRRPGAGPHAPENHGFALGNNLALAHATGDVVVFLNNDTQVPPGWLAPLREALTTTTCSAPSRCCSTRPARSSPPASRSPPAAGCRTRSSRASRPRTRTASRGCASRRSPGPRSRCATPTRSRCAASTRSSPTAWRTSTCATGCAAAGDGHFRVLDTPPGGPPRVAVPGPRRQAPRQPHRLPRPLAAGRRAT